jgi:hypothetical protein
MRMETAPRKHARFFRFGLGAYSANVSATEQKQMTETLSIRIDASTKKRLDALSKRSKRSKSLLAGEAITAYRAHCTQHQQRQVTFFMLALGARTVRADSVPRK